MSNTQGLVEVKGDKLQESPEEAQKNPISVQVDRVLAKVAINLAGKDNGVNTNETDEVKVKVKDWTQDGVLGAFRGVVKEDTSYRFRVEPRRPFTGTPRYTELFLVVDGKEEQLIPQLKEQNTPSGPNYRYKIKQIE